MRTFNFIGFLVAFVWSNGWASNPSKWEIRNQTNANLFIECSAKIDGLPGVLVKFSSSHLIPPLGIYHHTWEGMDNDGLGMNPGTWTCAADSQKHPLENPSTLKNEFQTNWGEDVRIHMEPSPHGWLIRR
jgi:hypothetical protein